MNYSRIVLWALIALAVVSPTHAQLTTYWRLYENQLDIEEGGQVNSIAVSPFDPHVMYVASETGGLFKSTSAGSHWIHVDKLPVIFTQSVVILPSDHPSIPEVVLVSAKADFKTKNGGGVWRSTDGGASWTQTLKDTPGQERMSAFELSLRPGTDTVFVGTSDGAFVSFNGGAIWTQNPVFNGADKTVFSVMATAGRIFFGGPSGVRTASADLTLQPLSSGNPIRSMHAFAQRGTTRDVFFVDEARQLFVSLNEGDFWLRIQHEPEGTGKCGGVPFIKAVDHGVGVPVDLFYSNRCTLHRLVTPLFQGGNPNYFADDWHQVPVDRGGPRELAFVSSTLGSAPLLLGTTAGLHKQAAPNDWHLAGGGRDGGYNALQINEVKGQFVAQERADLYVGTHENGLFAATLSGDIVTRRGSGGHFIELERSVAVANDSRITFTINEQDVERNEQSKRQLTNVQPWLNASGHRTAPVLLKPCRYVQNVLFFRRLGMDITEDCGASWDRFAFFFREQLTDIPKVGLVAPTATFLYQSFKRNADGAGSLMRLVRFTGLPTDVQFPEMSPTDGSPAVGLGINPTGFGGYQVYAVDPYSVQHIVAPDIVNGRMTETSDGARNWSAMGQLTNLVKGVDGFGVAEFLFNTDLAGPAVGKVFPIVTAISRCPQPAAANLVLAGTMEGGIFASNDNGVTWNKIVGSEKATYITSFFWETANTVYVSTYGRGLWKLKVRSVAPNDGFDDLCPRCNVVAIDPRPGRPPFDGSAMVFNGQMLGVRTDNRKLREVFVTPGSSVLLTGDTKDPQDDIAITETDARDPVQYEPLPQPKDGWIVTGVVFTSDDTLVGTVYAESEMTLPPPVSKDPIDVKGPTESPTLGKPYITLTTSASAAVPTVEPEEVFDLSATDFTAGKSYEVLIDGVPIVKGDVTADSTGGFETRVTAPSAAGYHRVTVRMAGDEKVIDGSLFFVRMEN